MNKMSAVNNPWGLICCWIKQANVYNVICKGWYATRPNILNKPYKKNSPKYRFAWTLNNQINTRTYVYLVEQTVLLNLILQRI